jgi:hypothetical protein
MRFMNAAPLTVRCAVLVALVCPCNHSAVADYSSAELNGPRTSGADVQLTYNVQENHTPTWASDGKGILYPFVDPVHPAQWCLGILPPTGSTRVWEYCERRAAYQDTTVSAQPALIGQYPLLRPGLLSITPDYRFVDLATGLVRTEIVGHLHWLPKRPPVSGDVVMQYDGWMGNFGSWSGPPSGTLHLLQNFLPCARISTGAQT